MLRRSGTCFALCALMTLAGSQGVAAASALPADADPTPSATATQAPSPTATPATATPSATASATSTSPSSPAPSTTSPVPSTSSPTTAPPAAPPVTRSRPPVNAALQPATDSRILPTVTIVLPGTGERRDVTALPYALDRDHDGDRESVGFVLEPDLTVPVSPHVTLRSVPSWDSASSPQAVPDPADWATIRDRVASIGAAASTATGRAAMLKEARLDLSGQPGDEVTTMVEQAAQVAIWRISSHVSPAKDYRYTPGGATTSPALTDGFATLVDHLVSSGPRTPAPTAAIYRVHVTGATARTAHAGRAIPRSSGAPEVSLMVAGADAPTPTPTPTATPVSDPAPPTPLPDPVRTSDPTPASTATAAGAGRITPMAPVVPMPSCLDLHRTDVSSSDVDYTQALDTDGDGVACESNGQDGPVDLSHAGIPTTPTEVTSVAAAPSDAAQGVGAAMPAYTPTALPVAGQPAAVPVAGQPASGSFATCTDAQLAGRTDIPSYDPAYQPSLDADGDGVACEAAGEGAPATATQTGQLARTGVDVAALVGPGVGGILLGSALLVLTRRRRHS